MRNLILAATAAFFMSGCATLTEGNTDARLVTQYAVLKIAGNDSAKADRIEAIALEIQKYASGETFLTVDLLISAVSTRIPWEDLDAPDELLVRALLDRLRTELVARLGDDVLPEDLRLAVDTLAGWVVAAARMV